MREEHQTEKRADKMRIDRLTKNYDSLKADNEQLALQVHKSQKELKVVRERILAESE